MKCSDIPDLPILEFLAKHEGKWCIWFGDGSIVPNVAHAMPPGTPEKLILAKMRGLMQRGLVSGCGCGCRGDFEITYDGVQSMRELQDRLRAPGSDGGQE